VLLSSVKRKEPGEKKVLCVRREGLNSNDKGRPLCSHKDQRRGTSNKEASLQKLYTPKELRSFLY